jgi:hypothetical protein
MNTIGQVISKGRPDILKVKLPPAPQQDEWVSAREAAHRAGIEHVTVWRWAQRGIIPHRRAGRLVLVPAQRVAQLAQIWHEHGARSRWLFRADDPDHAYIPVTRA